MVHLFMSGVILVLVKPSEADTALSSAVCAVPVIEGWMIMFKRKTVAICKRLYVSSENFPTHSIHIPSKGL